MMPSSHDFMAALDAAGLAMHKPDLVADGCLHRYRVEGDKAGSKNGWYVLHLDERPFGAFGSWKTGQSETWAPAKSSPTTPEERKALAARQAAAKAAREAEQVKVHAEGRQRAASLWGRAHPASNEHPYLVKKQVGAYGIRELNGQIVIPLRDAAGVLHSLQFIGPDGKKTFLTGGRVRGCYHAIGKPEGVLCICEGYATAATVYEATRHATACAFNAGNLEPVARALRCKFPRCKIVLCADNDTETAGNPGVTAATAAARAVGGFLAVPRFREAAHG